ncbi:MAG: hypothetical protein OXC60_11825 [Litoreibacter sp.]|nr:hypothetical protein [Litoreibacter sp.]
MFRTEEFEVFVDPARDDPQIWRIILGVITAGVVYIVPILLLFVLAGILFPERVFEIQMALSEASTPLSMFVLLSTFFFMGLAAIAAAGVHRRGLASLIGPFRPACRNFSRAIVAVVVIYLAVGSVTAFFLQPSSINLELSYWLSLMPLAIVHDAT